MLLLRIELFLRKNRCSFCRLVTFHAFPVEPTGKKTTASSASRDIKRVLQPFQVREHQKCRLHPLSVSRHCCKRGSQCKNIPVASLPAENGNCHHERFVSKRRISGRPPVWYCQSQSLPDLGTTNASTKQGRRIMRRTFKW